MYQFITQGYACTAVVLFFVYCFYEPARSLCFQLARISNILIWLAAAFILFTALYFYLMFKLIAGDALFEFLSFIADISLNRFLLPFPIIVVALLFRKIRKHAVWLLLPIAWMLNQGILTGDLLEGGWFTKLSTWPRFIIFGAGYSLLLLFIRNLMITAKQKDFSLPNRI
jgi:hypothetical protein